LEAVTDIYDAPIRRRNITNQKPLIDVKKKNHEITDWLESKTL
jgi:hypothetical protein